ncbi:hypothetical protein [Longimicrobium terrae]|uniref:Uncharacterized protein n=1 Tax=Longimicrobium terrae TaxID=1639882 RepID=A0A841H866_9BACT|nr:hypothetical protein [Longimicrobium terrae]MBB4639630.1 hypothetical protein [Longimicrobium terrae]MBB6074026.1 hypothetical protein [Longimicrobium terrae]NNC29369.1 hypothetical protein [Longimicrobium terrae]
MKTVPHRQRRPTVPFGEWRISLDLQATREVASAPALARGCRCPWCRNWAAAWERVLPPDVVSGLRRLGIDPADPADLYCVSHRPRDVDLRVIYYCVGVVRDGPVVWREDPRFEQTARWYQELRPAPWWLSVSVVPQRHLHDLPLTLDAEVRDLIQVDFRLTVPWVLDEEHPMMIEARSYPKQPVIWAGGRLRPASDFRRKRPRTEPNPI